MAADKRATRLGVLALVWVLLFGAIGVRLWFLQTVRQQELQELVTGSKTKVVPLLPHRGRIFDAKGRIVADNERILTVAVDWQVLRKTNDRAEIFRRLSGRIEVPIEEMEARFQSNRYSTFLPMPVKEDVSEAVAISLQERAEDLPGVQILEESRRIYPYSPLAAHVIGYMGAITKENLDEYLADGYDRNERVGQFGVERSMEATLHGQWGKIVYEVDASNRPVRQLSYQPPVNGMDVQLSIDLDLQQYAEQALQTQLEQRRTFTAPNPIVLKPNGTRERMDPTKPEEMPYKAPAGSVIVMNHNNGSIVAMASYPTFDNRWFNAGISGDKFQQLFPETDDPDLSILVNRAVQGRYNLGSTFKPFTAYAALSAGLLNGGTFYNDTGQYKLTSIDDDVCATGVKCVLKNAICGNGLPCVYGQVNVQLALAVSSDAFFYKLGEEFFLKSRTLLQDQVKLFGYGADTGVDLPFEYDGRVPDDASKRELVEAGVLAKGEDPTYYVGDSVQLAIGQGLLASTPLQVAVGYATLANGGFVERPQVVQTVYEPGVPDGEPGFADLTAGRVVASIGNGEVVRQIPMGPELRDPIVNGLRQNITGPGANGRSTTAQELFATGYPETAIPVAGKTGTAQGQGNYPWNDSSVFAAFSVDATRPYTAVTYLEKSGFGSRGAAPVVKCLFLVLSGVVQPDRVVQADPLDITSRTVARPQRLADTTCMASAESEARPVD